MNSALESVSYATDREIIDALVNIHLEGDPSIVLDATYGSGVWWTPADCVYGSDVRVSEGITVVADFNALPYRGDVADVVVFDPPHRSLSGPNGSGYLHKRFGTLPSSTRGLAPLLPSAFTEIQRVLRPQGIALVKIADQVNSRRNIHQFVSACVIADVVGLSVCDYVIKVRKQPVVVSSTWQVQRHARKRHAFWVVLRKGGCETLERLRYWRGYVGADVVETYKGVRT